MTGTVMSLVVDDASPQCVALLPPSVALVRGLSHRPLRLTERPAWLPSSCRIIYTYAAALVLLLSGWLLSG